VTILDCHGGCETLPLLSKREVARKLLYKIANQLGSQPEGKVE
jgi:hypothetical protein